MIPFSLFIKFDRIFYESLTSKRNEYGITIPLARCDTSFCVRLKQKTLKGEMNYVKRKSKQKV